MAISDSTQPVPGAPTSRTSFKVLGAISLSHLLNDMIQSLILAIYPLLQSEFSLTFVQIGMITLTFQLASSLLQPVVGYWTDKYPMPWSLPIGMCFTLSGLVLLAIAGSFEAVLIAAALVGTGSSVFHPESSRVARMASGGRHGLAQSLFQVGGNFGSSLGPLLAAVIIAPYGKGNVAWFVLAALLAIVPLGFLMVLNARKKERENAHPLIAPRLLQLRSIRFGVLIGILFFSVWSGFMFCMALTMQTGLGMAPWQSGNSFIALGVTYFISAWFAPRLIARYSTSAILLTGLAIQLVGLVALIATFRVWGMENTPLTLAPATGLVGYGQALIVNSFYRIGMRDIQPDDAGAASAILSTLQQAALGLGPAIFGAILLHALQNHHGDYTQAVNVFLMVETTMMVVLALATLRIRHSLCLPVAKICQAAK